jgi:ABC-type multidrug transport system permease subunit
VSYRDMELRHLIAVPNFQEGGFGLIDLLFCKALLNNIINKAMCINLIQTGGFNSSKVYKWIALALSMSSDLVALASAFSFTWYQSLG